MWATLFSAAGLFLFAGIAYATSDNLVRLACMVDGMQTDNTLYLLRAATLSFMDGAAESDEEAVVMMEQVQQNLHPPRLLRGIYVDMLSKQYFEDVIQNLKFTRKAAIKQAQAIGVLSMHGEEWRSFKDTETDKIVRAWKIILDIDGAKTKYTELFSPTLPQALFDCATSNTARRAALFSFHTSTPSMPNDDALRRACEELYMRVDVSCAALCVALVLIRFAKPSSPVVLDFTHLYPDVSRALEVQRRGMKKNNRNGASIVPFLQAWEDGNNNNNTSENGAMNGVVNGVINVVINASGNNAVQPLVRGDTIPENNINNDDATNIGNATNDIVSVIRETE